MSYYGEMRKVLPFKLHQVLLLVERDGKKELLAFSECVPTEPCKFDIVMHTGPHTAVTTLQYVSTDRPPKNSDDTLVELLKDFAERHQGEL